MSKRITTALLCIVCFITFFVNNDVLIPDIMESRNIITAREMVDGGNWIVPTMNGELRLEKPPLPTWLTAIAQMAAPDNLNFIRGMAALSALLLCLFFYKFAQRVLRIEPVIPTLLLCTCYNVILTGRTASWDIYTHAFMMGGIYFLARAMLNDKRKWSNFICFGIFTGLSIMSKGPVSLYALFLPFLISFIWFYRPDMKGKWWPLVTSVLLAVIIGAWWYALVHITEADAWQTVLRKESGAWVSHNVRPWYYYWKFFLETGVWSLLLLMAMFVPMFSPGRRKSRKWLFSMGWMLASLLLLSLMPEKKPRYLFPLLIPAAYVMGCMLQWWRVAFSTFDRGSRTDRIAFRVNAGIIAAVVTALPVLAWFFCVSKGYLSVTVWVIFSLLCMVIAGCMFVIMTQLKVNEMVVAVTALFVVSECLVMPVLRNVVNNPDNHSISATRERPDLKGIPFYSLQDEPLRIELVYAAGRIIRPLNLDTLEKALPCVVLSHKPIGEYLPEPLAAGLDTIAIDRFDDNRRPKGTKRYSPEFIYYTTLIKRENSRNP